MESEDDLVTGKARHTDYADNLNPPILHRKESFLPADQPRSVELVFGNEKQLARVSKWRAPVGARQNPYVRDTLEFARLASKRWRYYHTSVPTATSLAAFRAAVRRNKQVEVSFLLMARAAWFPSSVPGLVQCRRTYCHHFILEFLAVHPSVVGKVAPRVQGVGSGLLYSLAELAGTLGAPLIWGEATVHSAQFYAKALGVPAIEDYFFIRDSILEHCRRAFSEKFFGKLDPA